MCIYIFLFSFSSLFFNLFVCGLSFFFLFLGQILCIFIVVCVSTFFFYLVFPCSFVFTLLFVYFIIFSLFSFFIFLFYFPLLIYSRSLPLPTTILLSPYLFLFISVSPPSVFHSLLSHSLSHVSFAFQSLILSLSAFPFFYSLFLPLPFRNVVFLALRRTALSGEGNS